MKGRWKKRGDGNGRGQGKRQGKVGRRVAGEIIWWEEQKGRVLEEGRK